MWTRYRQMYWSCRGISSCEREKPTVNMLPPQLKMQERGGGVQRDDGGPGRAALTQLAPDHARGPSTRLLASWRARHQLPDRGVGLG